MNEAQEYAGFVELAVKSALTPVLQRLAAAEAKAVPLTDVAAIRERLVAVETKCCAIPVGPDVSVEQRLHAAMDRLSALEYALSRAESHESMIADLKARLSAAEAVATHYAELAATARELIQRVAVVEAKSGAPSVAEPLLTALSHRVQTLETRVIEDPAMKECAVMRERVAIVESRAAVPGPAGPAGKDGANGQDGLGWGDLVVVQGDDERTFTFQGERDGRVKTFGTFTVPAQIYRGVWNDSQGYAKGDSVTHAGSEWHANEPTTAKPGEGSKAWTLKVKRGRDGRDGRDAPGALPVVQVR